MALAKKISDITIFYLLALILDVPLLVAVIIRKILAYETKRFFNNRSRQNNPKITPKTFATPTSSDFGDKRNTKEKTFTKAKISPKHGRYYDLIRVPHGHIPAPLANFWSRLPIPIKEKRDYDFYFCPECGEPSFFKINYCCRECEDNFQYSSAELERRMYRRYRRRIRRKYFKELLKRIEYWFLPILLALGKAWYVESTRSHWRDYDC